MTTKPKIYTGIYPLYLFILPVFFVLHGFRENYDFVSVREAIGLTGIYLVACVSFLLLSYFFFRNWQKAAILSFLLMSFEFFFGSIQDSIKKVNDHSFFLRYSFVFPVILIALVVLVIYLKKTRRTFVKTGLYLNTLLILLILIDVCLLASKMISFNKVKSNLSFTTERIKTRPDVYLIVMDEYAGLQQLKEQLGFDNSPFENELRRQQFLVVPKSVSNYLSTPLSIASVFKMDYLNLNSLDQEQDRVLLSYKEIRKGSLLHFFLTAGYEFHNLSIFDFSGQKAITKPTFLPTGKKLITSQTFISRIENDLGYHLYTTLGLKQDPAKDIYTDLENNSLLFDRTSKLVSQKTEKPRFVYTHLMMPHYPYYFTKDGVQRPLEQLLVENKTNPSYYLEYLGYCNRKIIGLVTSIRENSPQSVIVLMGDHGFRALEEKLDKPYLFDNLCSVYLPSQNYSGFREGLSAVNLFRTILNAEFNQALPEVKDSCVIIN